MHGPGDRRSYQSPDVVLAEARRMAAQIRRQAEREAALVRRDAAEWASAIRREAEDRLREVETERTEATIDLSDDDHEVLYLGDFDPSGVGATQAPAARRNHAPGEAAAHDGGADGSGRIDETTVDPLSGLAAILPSPPVVAGVVSPREPEPVEPEPATVQSGAETVRDDAVPSETDPAAGDDPYELGRLVALGSLLDSTVFDRPVRPTGVAAERLPRRRAGDVIDLGSVAQARRRAQERRDEAATAAEGRMAVQEDPVETSIETRVHDIVRLAVRRTFPRRTS